MILAFSSPAPLDAANAVAMAFLKEKDDAVRASELLALGVLNARAQTLEHAALMAFCSGDDPRLKKPSPLVAVAAILALGYARPFAITASMLGRLRKSQRVEAPAEALPWYGGKLGALAKKRLPALEKVDVDAWMRDLDTLIAAHPPQGHTHDPLVVEEWVAFVYRLLEPFQGRQNDEVLPEELSEDQRELLVQGYKKGLVPVFVQLGIGCLDTNLSHGRFWSMGRFLGIVSPGALDQRTTIHGRNAPWWKVFIQLARGEIAAPAVKKAVLALSDTDVLALAEDVAQFAYKPTSEEGVLEESPRAALLLGELDARGLTAKHAQLRAKLESMANATG
jgi:hypothetical protein